MTFPPEIVVTLKQLMKLEYLAQGGRILPKRSVHSVLAGKNASKLRGRGLDFEEVRRYAFGDDIRNIDWKVTARTKVTHTKVFNEEKERPVFTIVDQSSFMFFGSQQYVKSVIAAQAAALGGFRTLKVGDRFGGIIFGDEGYEHIRPKRSRVAVMRFLEAVTNYNEQLPNRKRLSSNVERLNEMLKRAHMAITHDYVVTVISDLADANEETFQHLINLSMHNDVIVVNISDPLDQVLPNEKLVLTDGDQQINWDGKKSSDQKNYEKAFLQLKDGLEGKLRKYGIAVLMLSTGRPVIAQMKEVFGRGR